MIRPGFFPIVLALLVSLAVSVGSHGDEPPRPEHLPELVYQRWSDDLNVPDPVAISVADNGDVYVTQTQRRKIQDLDIRQHTKWIPDDVGFQRVGDKRRFYRETFPVDGDQTRAAEHLQDLNRDGTIDWRDLTVISEKIHRLVDADGNGTADQINLFAEGFQTEVTGIAAGVMHWHDNVYATIAPDVWKLADQNGDGVADERSVLASGFGVHIAYAGHDMHGLTIGPDGKIYWSIGDKGIAAVDSNGDQHNYPNQGGVMRCNPDGTEFEVFAHGLRNVQEFAFDQHGNLFGVDNDADKPGERERFVWIVDQMDAGWRCNYQYRGSDYDPWVAEKLWETTDEKRSAYRHPAYIVPPISHYVDGPAGFKFNPGAALSSAYKNYFFVTSAPNGFQYAFRCEPKGDSFRMVDSHLIGSGDPIVGIAFGPDGGLFGVDWGGGYPLNQRGGVIRIDVAQERLSESDRDARNQVRDWLREGFAKRSDQELLGMLSHPDQRIRLRAQFELARRDASASFLEILGDSASDPLARVHSVWGLGQILRAKKRAAESLRPFLLDPDPVVRKVTCKTLGESKGSDGRWFIPLLSDTDLHVQIHAALAIARCPTEAAVSPLFQAARRTLPNQHYLRHSVATALASCATAEQLVEGATNNSRVRICAVIALRRQRDPAVAAFLSDPEWVATEAARAIHDDFSIPEAMPALAEFLDQPRIVSEAMARRMINANYRLGGVQHSRRLVRYAADFRNPKAMRLEAVEALGEWLDPPLLDRVEGRRRDLSGDRKIDRAKVKECFVKMVSDSPTEFRVAAVKAARQLKIALSREALFALYRDSSSPENLRLEALDSLAADATQRADMLGALIEQSEGSSERVAAASIRALADVNFDAALRIVPNLLDSNSVMVRQAVIAALADIPAAAADQHLANLGGQFTSGQLDHALKLDVWQALTKRGEQSTTAASVVRGIQSLPELTRIEDAKLRPFALARDGGDPQRGEQIFRTDLRAQCIRCHRVDKQGSNIGPPLDKIARQRDADHLLRAIVYPSADIEPKYNSQSVLLFDGQVVQGVIQSEDDQRMILVASDGKKIEIPTDEIDAVAESKQSLMPETTGVLRPQEVRDLVAYLRTLR